jgi:hypothetical protein
MPIDYVVQGHRPNQKSSRPDGVGDLGEGERDRLPSLHNA